MHVNTAAFQSIEDPDNAYLYNGKEKTELGIDWLFYGARYYDAAVGRFTGVDPLASDFAGWTPYHYVHNNPIILTDPTGMKADSTYLINTATNEYTAIDGKGGNEIDFIQVWNGVDIPKEGAEFEEFMVAVETVSLEGTGYSSTRLPGFKIETYIPSQAIEPFDDPFTGGIQKAGLGVGSSALLALIKTSSKKTNPSVVYAIMKGDKFHKFGVSGSDLKRYKTSLREAGQGAKGRVISSKIPKYRAHILEKYFTSLHWRKYGRMPTGQKIPFPVDLLTGKRIRPK